jgi:hypothetical protein
MASLGGQIRKEPLFRKVNTRARGVHHNFGGDYRHDRNTKREVSSEETRGTMHGREQRGLDYTPLFKFLLSKVGRNWDDVYSEALARIDKKEPIFWMVAMHEKDKKNYFSVGESSYFSGLYVDSQGLLQVVNPNLNNESAYPHCSCCTHTFNGLVFTKKYLSDDENIFTEFGIP